MAEEINGLPAVRERLAKLEQRMESLEATVVGWMKDLRAIREQMGNMESDVVTIGERQKGVLEKLGDIKKIAFAILIAAVLTVGGALWEVIVK